MTATEVKAKILSLLDEVAEGDTVERSARIGIIRFGSRVDVFFPLHWDVLCAVGDTVTSGTILVEIEPQTL